MDLLTKEIKGCMRKQHMKDTKDHSKKCGRSSRSNLQKNPNLNPILKLQHNSEEHIRTIYIRYQEFFFENW